MKFQPNTARPSPATLLARRWFLQQCGVGLGAAALADLLGDQTARRRQPAGTEAAALPGEGEERHLPVHGRRPEPPGTVRQQAGAWRSGTASCRRPDLLKGYRAAFINPELEAARARSSSSPGTASPGRNCPNCCRTWRRSPTTLCIVKSMVTDAFNHAPAQIFMNTGAQQFGRPSLGAWTLYGLGSESKDLPGFVVFSTGSKGPSGGNSNWGSGFLPTVYQGVQFRTGGDPVLYLSNPRGVDDGLQRDTLDGLNAPESDAPRRGRRSGDRHAHQRVRDGLPHADQPPRT